MGGGSGIPEVERPTDFEEEEQKPGMGKTILGLVLTILTIALVGGLVYGVVTRVAQHPSKGRFTICPERGECLETDSFQMNGNCVVVQNSVLVCGTYWVRQNN